MSCLRLLLLLCLATPALAETVDDLKAKAATALGQRDYKTALKHLEAAFELDPQPELSANIGFVQFNLGQYAEAATAFERFLASNPPAAKAQRAEDMLNRIKPVIKLRSDPSGAVVKGKSGAVGRTPVDIRLLVGRHAFRFEKEGFAPLKLDVKVRENRSATILRTLIPLDTGPRRMDMTVEEPPPDRSPVRAGPWVALAGTVVATAGAAGFYVLTQDSIDQRDAARTGSAWDGHQVDAETWNSAMWASAGVAAITAGITAWLFSR